MARPTLLPLTVVAADPFTVDQPPCYSMSKAIKKILKNLHGARPKDWLLPQRSLFEPQCRHKINQLVIEGMKVVIHLVGENSRSEASDRCMNNYFIFSFSTPPKHSSPDSTLPAWSVLYDPIFNGKTPLHESDDYLVANKLNVVVQTNTLYSDSTYSTSDLVTTIQPN